MLKPLTFSVGLAVALVACSLGYAGDHHKSLPSAQGYAAPSAQAAWPSAQGDYGCGDACGPVEKKGCRLFDMFKPKPKCYSYEWVLRKKKCGGGLFGGLFGNKGGCGGGGDACGGCGGYGGYGETAWPSAQGYAAPSAQGFGAAYGSGQTGAYGSGQIGGHYGSGQIGGQFGSGQVGSGQVGAGQAMPMPGGPGDGVGPAPETDPVDDAADDTASTGGLLYLAPAGN